jgi:hypothetical protein
MIYVFSGLSKGREVVKNNEPPFRWSEQQFQEMLGNELASCKVKWRFLRLVSVTGVFNSEILAAMNIAMKALGKGIVAQVVCSGAEGLDCDKLHFQLAEYHQNCLTARALVSLKVQYVVTQ